tara:strand:- start:5056 stop:5415 length:360 start_codon:yes stop_codon:yes gene_type:complete
MYKISKQTHLDSFTKCYKNIVVISLADNNDVELKKHLKTVPRSTLSPFKTFDCCRDESTCVQAFIDKDTNDFILLDNIEKVINILNTLGYVLDYDLTKMMLKNKTDRSLLFYAIKRNGT